MEKNVNNSNDNNLTPSDNQIDPTYEKKKIIISYAITIFVIISISIGLIFIFLGIRDFFSTSYSKELKYRYLADAFTIPAIVFIFLGFLFIVSSKGIFTGLGYGLNRLGRFLLPFIFRKDITYAQYIENKEYKLNKVLTFSSFIVGFILLITAIIFIILFYNASN